MPTRDCEKVSSIQSLEDCSIALANQWWRQAQSFEDAIGYAHASAEARLAWDAIVERQYPQWSAAFLEELELTISIWRRRYPCAALLDAICSAAQEYNLALPHYALLAVFRLRCVTIRPF